MNGRRSEHWSGLNRKAVLLCDSPQNTQTHCVTLCDTPQNTATHCSCCSSLIALCCMTQCGAGGCVVLECVLWEVVLCVTLCVARGCCATVWVAGGCVVLQCELHWEVVLCYPVCCERLAEHKAWLAANTGGSSLPLHPVEPAVDGKSANNCLKQLVKITCSSPLDDSVARVHGWEQRNRRNRRNSKAPASHSFFFSPLQFLLILLTAAKLTTNTASISFLFLNLFSLLSFCFFWDPSLLSFPFLHVLSFHWSPSPLPSAFIISISPFKGA